MTDPSTALDRPALTPPPAVMDSAEMEQTWRVAKALAASGFFKDAQQAEQAFGKILLGRDMGLAPMEAMLSIHLIEGKAEMSADFHATRVKLTPGYDYSVVELTNEKCELLFWRDGDEIGTSVFTVEDAKTAGLWDRKGPKGGDGNWKKYPRNMLFARAMSNGVAWFCPEVMGAVRVYSPGEVEDLAPPIGEPAPTMTPDELGNALIDADDLSTATVNLIPSVVATVKRAQKLGHAGHGDAATVAMLLRGQPAEKVEAWLVATNDDLEELVESRRGPVEEPADAVVVDGDDGEPVPGPEDAAALRQRAAEMLKEADAVLNEDPVADNAEDFANGLKDEAAQLVARAREMDEFLQGLKADPAEQAELGVE